MISVVHVLSTRLLSSRIFDDLVQRQASAAPADVCITAAIRPDPTASVLHYHRPHREARLRAGSVATVHHDPHETYFWLRVGRFLPRWREAEAVICLNRGQVEFLAAHGIDRTELIPHGVDRTVLPVPNTARRFVGGRVRLGLVSKRYDRGIKGEARLEALLARLDPAHFAFMFVGEGRWREAALARGLGFAAECWESLPYRLFGELYRRMDALLILSDHEGGPACLPEALGAGVPVLATPVGMVPDWVRDGENGLLLSGRPVEDAGRIAALAERQGAALERLFTGAFTGASVVPSWEEVAGRQIALYRRVAAGGRP